MFTQRSVRTTWKTCSQTFSRDITRPAWRRCVCENDNVAVILSHFAQGKKLHVAYDLWYHVAHVERSLAVELEDAVAGAMSKRPGRHSILLSAMRAPLTTADAAVRRAQRLVRRAGGRGRARGDPEDTRSLRAVERQPVAAAAAAAAAAAPIPPDAIL